MGPIKTYGPTVLAAIEQNDINKVTDIMTNKFRDKQKTKQFLVSEVRRLQSESVAVPLLAATTLDDPSILRFLVNEHGADINFVYECGTEKHRKCQMAVLTAVKRSCYTMVDVIVSLGGDVNAQDHKGRTPLHHAVRRANRRMVRMLLSRGAKLDICDADGQLPLDIATMYGHQEMVRLLMSYGGNLCRPGGSGTGSTPIHGAAREGHVNLLQMFGELYRADGNFMAQCEDGISRTPLHVAATEGNPDSVKALLEFCSADPNLKDSEGNATIHCALANKCDIALGTPSEDEVVDTVRVLISHGADINRSNGLGDTALHLAARNGFSKAVQVLVEAGCDTLLSDNFGHQAINLLAPNDEFSKNIIMAAMTERTSSRAAVVSELSPPGTKSKLSHPPGMKSYKSGSTILSKEPPGTTDLGMQVARPRPAVRKTKSVENLDQESDNAPKQEKSKTPNPVARAPRIRSNSVQGPEVTDLNDSNVGQSAGKKLSVLKQKKGKKLIESEEQPEAELPLKTRQKNKVLKLNVSTNETTSLDRTTDSEEYPLNDNAKAYGKMIPPQVPKKTIKTKNDNGAHTKKEESQPSLQAWLDEQARLLKEREQADQGGPVAQSTPPTIRNKPLSKEYMETSTNDSDSDGNMLAERRAKLKPPPPPKPMKAKTLSVSSVVGVTTQKADLSSAVKDRTTASDASQNLKEVQNFILQRRDSQTSLTGVAQLGIGEDSLCYEPASPIIDSIPSKANSRLNMSLDSARSNPTSKENRPVPKSRDVSSGAAQRSNLNSVMKRFEHETAATSGSHSSDENKVVTTAGKIKQHPMSVIKDSEDVSPLAAQRKQTLGPEQQSSRKPVGLVFQKASADVLPEKILEKTHPSHSMDKDFVDRSIDTRKSSVANVSRSSETFPKPSDEHKPSSHPVTMKHQSKAAIVQESESEEEEEDSEEESEDSEEEEENEEEEESEDEDEEEEEEVETGRKVVNTNTTAKPLRSQEIQIVTFYSQDNPGFTVIGGNAEGIFVHSLDPSSEAARNGLSNGDQILRVNGQRVLGRTKEEATQMLQVRGGELSLHIRTIPDQYKVVMENGGIGDGFFVQAQFNYDAGKKGELNIHEGDIFSVTDTLLENSPGVWKAHKINAKKNEEQIGTIPNRQKADQIMVKYRLSHGKPNPDQRGSGFFRSFKRSKSAERNSRNQEEEERNSSTVTSGVVSYQRVIQRLSENRRPIIVLGLFCDIVISMLIHDSPELFETPQEEVETSKSSEEPVNVRLIRGSYHRGKHCLIILTPPSIEYLLQKTDLNPIVIYISPVSKSVVKAVKAKLAPNYNKNAGYMYDEAAKFEKTYVHLFSTSVAYTTDDWWFFHLKEAIGRMQNQSIWRTITDEEVEASAVTELNKICPVAAVLPLTQVRQSRDKTPRFSRTTDDLPVKAQAQNGASVRGRPPLAGNREPQNSVEAQEVRKELIAKSILKQRAPGGSVSSDQVSIKSGIPKSISVSFDEQEPSDMPKYVTGKMQKPRIPTNNMGRETLL